MAAIANYEKAYTPEQRQLADHLIGLERSALDKWFKGDTSGYANLWSQHSFTYFDIVVDKRVDDYPTIKEFLNGLNGKLHADSYDFIAPRVQFGTDMAVLTYQLFSNTNLIDMKYNVIEIFQKEGNDWKVIHSTWSYIKPMEADFSNTKAGV